MSVVTCPFQFRLAVLMDVQGQRGTGSLLTHPASGRRTCPNSSTGQLRELRGERDFVWDSHAGNAVREGCRADCLTEHLLCPHVC